MQEPKKKKSKCRSEGANTAQHHKQAILDKETLKTEGLNRHGD